MRFIIALTLLGASHAAAVPAPTAVAIDAQGPVRFDAGDPAMVAELMRGMGYEVEVDTEEGPPALFSEHEGLTFGVWFYACRGASRCGEILLESTFTVEDGLSLRRLNEWNRDAFMGRAYLNDYDEAIVEHFVVVEGGIERDTLKQILERWGETVEFFAEHLY